MVSASMPNSCPVFGFLSHLLKLLPTNSVLDAPFITWNLNLEHFDCSRSKQTSDLIISLRTDVVKDGGSRDTQSIGYATVKSSTSSLGLATGGCKEGMPASASPPPASNCCP
jgi:hypothetical protein